MRIRENDGARAGRARKTRIPEIGRPDTKGKGRCLRLEEYLCICIWKQWPN